MKKILVSLLFLVGIGVNGVMAQCAMCRTTLENNFSNGDAGIAAGINFGILYLLVLPYLAVVVVGLLWYKSTKNGGKELTKRVA
jgi:H+/Cl- antiporter ClcA